MKMILPKVEEEESLEKEFKWAVEGLLLPLVCLVGVLGNIDISLDQAQEGMENKDSAS